MTNIENATASMKLHIRILAIFVIVLALSTGYLLGDRNLWFVQKEPEISSLQTTTPRHYLDEGQALPQPGTSALNSLLKNNLPRRTYADSPLTTHELSELLWAAQGMITPWGDRTTASYKSTYPLQVTALIRNVNSMENGVYWYDPGSHVVKKISSTGKVEEQFEQESMNEGAVIIAFSADLTDWDSETARWPFYAEAGAAAQNIYLKATQLALGTVWIWPQETEPLKTLFGIPENETLLLIMPVGRQVVE